jgi:DNA-binding SARP family transcriptional activator
VVAGTPLEQPSSAPQPAASAAQPVAAPIQVFCFGPPRVVCLGQQVWPRQPAGDAKPWEFLLYLACQPVAGVSREQLGEALWPDDDFESSATHRFRQLRYRLRGVLSTVLGEPVRDGISIERGGPLRLDPTIIHSDAQQFLQLAKLAHLTAGPELSAIPLLEQARALYTGDLFDGPDVRRYAWADERDESGVTLREHFRRLFVSATVALAGLYLETSQIESAIELYREASELDPGNERVWHALFRIHAQRGDRPALLREERRLRASLNESLGDVHSDGTAVVLGEPSHDLVLAFQRALTEIDARDPQAAAAAV